jgi:hypothetical protein
MVSAEKDCELFEDERKAFALFHMRSRVMEKDIERGLERRGGSFVVDYLVLTTYHRTARCVRDAVIIIKAWRDGATISDVINTVMLTRRTEYSYFIPRLPRTEGTTTDYRCSTWEDVR